MSAAVEHTCRYACGPVVDVAVGVGVAAGVVVAPEVTVKAGGGAGVVYCGSTVAALF